MGRIATRSPEGGPNEDLLGFSLLWMLLMVIATPLPAQILGGADHHLNFYFSPARLIANYQLRTERVAVIIIALQPVGF